MPTSDLKEDRDKRYKYEDEDYAPSSGTRKRAIASIKRKNDRSLRGQPGPALFAEVEAGEEYIELPTGEKYPVNAAGARKSYDASPTATCVAKERESSD